MLPPVQPFAVNVAAVPAHISSAVETIVIGKGSVIVIVTAFEAVLIQEPTVHVAV